jgi:hypothetical protein
MSVRDELLRACAKGDEVTLRRHGWQPVWRALKSWWPKAFAAEDLRPYIRLLADEPPDHIVGALAGWSKTKRGQFRPSPAEIMHALHGEEPGADLGPKVNTGRGRDRAGTEQALRAVADAMRTEAPCSCDVRRPTWRIDALGVLRCLACSGLEWGQIYAAEDARLIATEEAA